ncbi:hypothetical protein B0H14DRAFT_3456018 [Mycena olivaceomarginata]|nr:hypothetical protein B0H14DRAFT_3456018 [Mycena olivaceomarginata]
MSDNKSIDFAPLTDNKRASSVATQDKALPFKPHTFWNALLPSSGHPSQSYRWFAHHPIDERTANGILNEALPHLAASTLSTSDPLPPDITVEWQYFLFPESDVTADGPSKDAENGATRVRP